MPWTHGAGHHITVTFAADQANGAVATHQDEQ